MVRKVMLPILVLSRIKNSRRSSMKGARIWGRFRAIVLLVLCLAVIAVSPWANGDVRVIEVRSPQNMPRVEGAPSRTQVIQIHGTIVPTDPAALEKRLPTIRNFSVSLNSVGGDVVAAMSLGRILRREDKSAVIGPDDVCISACVLVLAGATHRAIFGGKVGIHRPFVGQDSATTAEQQKAQYEGIEKTIRDYLREMNVDARLYDDMFRISPSNVKYLSPSELRAYGLEGSDPYREQAYHARRAKDLGISMQELLRRQNEAMVKCKDRKADFGKCYLAIEIGISDKEYTRRESVALTTCAGEPSRAEQVRCHDRIVHGARKAE
jgi:ATP-dependent protease ClpP protease subunit